MKFCILCRRIIRKGQKVSILSHSINCTEDNGDYSFLGEFCDNERMVHAACLNEQFGKLVQSLYGELDDEIAIAEEEPVFTKIAHFPFAKPVTAKQEPARNIRFDDINSVLVEMGEKASKQDIYKFIVDNNLSGDSEQFLEAWFKSRNSTQTV